MLISLSTQLKENVTSRLHIITRLFMLDKWKGRLYTRISSLPTPTPQGSCWMAATLPPRYQIRVVLPQPDGPEACSCAILVRMNLVRVKLDGK